MSNYVMGDIHGCYLTLQALLDKINFDTEQDKLWLTGDTINRGPQSLAVLKLLYSMKENVQLVLGNHEFYLFAAASSHKPHRYLQEILDDSTSSEMLSWLRQQPLVRYIENFDCVVVHAGIPHIWDLTQALALSTEVSNALQSDIHFAHLIEYMRANRNNVWHDSLYGYPRLDTIIQYLTRMRLCDDKAKLDFDYHGDLYNLPKDLQPWFRYENRLPSTTRILFGHWAALAGSSFVDNIVALDTGCVWKQHLTALRLEDNKFFRQSYID